jgi:hypothetical protein
VNRVLASKSDNSSGHHAMFHGKNASKFLELELQNITFYENEIPDFVASEMDRLYENIFSSASKFHIDGRALNATTYAHRREGRVTTILVFQRYENRVEVINECIELDENDIQRFSNAIFLRYRGVSFITFYAVKATVEKLTFPYQCFTCLEDIVLNLPVSPELYLLSLGKSTRQNISHYSKVIQRHLPSFEFKICASQDLTDVLIRKIIRFSCARISAKNQVSLHDEENTQKLVQLICQHGFVGVATIDGQVCAGAICSKLDTNYFLHVLAHDPLYDRYSLGTLCCYLTIRASIVNGGKTFHFLWGRMDYKYRLLGVQNDLQRVVVYRSHLQLFLNGAYAINIAFKGMGRRVKHWLLEPGHRDWRISRVAIRLEERAHRLFGKYFSQKP